VAEHPTTASRQYACGRVCVAVIWRLSPRFCFLQCQREKQASAARRIKEGLEED
jgi:hypothetical protein